MKHWIPVAMIAVLPIVIDAQSAAPPPLPDMSWKARFTSQYQYVRGHLVKMAEKMPPEWYAFQPTPEVKTFAANLGHIIRGNAGQCSALLGRRSPLADQDFEKTVTAKADLVKAVHEVFAFCDEYFTNLSDDQLKNGTYQSSVVRDGQKIPLNVPHISNVAAFLSHNNEMYGYMSVYMRLKGVIPPSSDRGDSK